MDCAFFIHFWIRLGTSTRKNSFVGMANKSKRTSTRSKSVSSASTAATSGSSSSQRAKSTKTPDTRRAVVSAQYHDHEGPVYGLITGESEGNCTVEITDVKGDKVVACIPVNRLKIGATVEKGWLAGKAHTYRGRYYLTPYSAEEDDEGNVEYNVWRQGQVEGIFKGR